MSLTKSINLTERQHRALRDVLAMHVENVEVDCFDLTPDEEQDKESLKSVLDELETDVVNLVNGNG